MLEVNDIHTYYGDSHILKGVSLELKEGEVVGLVGRNGAGKTTTLRSITGIQPPREGTIIFDGQDITHEDIATISNIGLKLVLEGRRPFPNLTVLENMQLATDTTHGSQWTIDRIFEQFPQLKDRKELNANNLSGGEQQMLVIAQALLGNPKLILLDEPMEGLAPQIVENIVEIIRQISDDGIPMLLVEQNFQVCLELMDYGYLLHQGEITFEGLVEEFREKPEQVNKYLAVQS